MGAYVYLDHAASSPEVDASAEAGRAYDASPYAGANPNSLHSLGRQAARALDGARSTIARCLSGGFRPADVTFTSGGTESNNLALLGLAEGVRARDARRGRVIVSAIEHDSVLDVVGQLRHRGFDVDVCPATRAGTLDVSALGNLLGGDVALVSVMSANNETGVVQPVERATSLAHGVGALFHTDAVQAFGRIPLKLDGVDAVSIAAHKIGGPVGVGALAVRGRAPLAAQSWGGAQEGGRRAGTQDVRGALCLAAAAEAACSAMGEAGKVVRLRADGLVGAVCAPGTGVHATVGAEVGRLPGIVHLLVEGVDSNTLVLDLDAAGFAVSAGSACSAGSARTSHVLGAMGVDGRLAEGALRVSFDERVGEDDLGRFGRALLDVVARRR